MINEAYDKVAHFQALAKQPISDKPCALEADRVRIRSNWMLGELEEFQNASNLYDQADALTDLLYYLLGAFVEMGIRPDPIFSIVHDANMSKLNTNSSPVKDEDGKVQKPEGWLHPDDAIRAAIDTMGERHGG